MSWIRSPDLAAITVQRSANWANNPTGSRYLSWFIWRTISFTANSQYYSLVTIGVHLADFWKTSLTRLAAIWEIYQSQVDWKFFPISLPLITVETLRSDDGDANENVAEKLTSRPLKPLRDYSKSPSHLKKGNFCWSWREGPYPSADRDDRIYRLAVPVSKKKNNNNNNNKIWSFHVVVVQGRQRNVQKSVMHVQSCFFPN